MAENTDSVVKQNDGGAGGGSGLGDGGETAEEKTARLEAQLAEANARAEQAESQVELLMTSDASAPTVEELKAKLDQATQELAEVRTVATATKEDVRKANIKVARAEIERDYPFLADQEGLIPDDDPERMKERAKQLAAYTETQIKNSRGSLEEAIAIAYGVPLGAGVRPKRDPEKQKERTEAVGAGDVDLVSQQVVKENESALFG